MRLKKKQLFSLSQKIFIVKNFYKLDENVVFVRDEMQKTFEIHINENVINKLIHLFEKTGSVAQSVYYDLQDPNSVPEMNETVKKEANSQQFTITPLQLDQVLKEEDPNSLMDVKVENLEPGPISIVQTQFPDNSDQIEDISHYVEENIQEDAILFSQDNKQEEVEEYIIEEAPMAETVDDDDNDWSSSEEQGASKAKPKRKAVKQTKCQYCKKSFCRRYLDEHYRKMHSEETPYHCPICNEGFKIIAEFRTHKQTHSQFQKRTNFDCTYCQKTLPNISAFNRHLKAHLGIKNHVCEWCGKGFLEATALKLHRRSHTGEKPFKCNICQKAFSTKGSYDIHYRIHTGERPYKCEYCEKAFVDSSTRNVHRRQHTGETPYVCHICGKSCKQAQNLRSHMRHIHGTEFPERPKY